MLWIDVKYLKTISAQLENFKETKSNENFQFRCPYCGDSKKNKYKTRGCFFAHDNSLIYKCHNCGVSCSFSKFIEQHAPTVHKEYSLEVFKAKSETQFTRKAEPDKPKFEKPKFRSTPKFLKKYPKISSLNVDHPAKKWVMRRCIPGKFHGLLHYAEEFEYEDMSWNDPRILIPFFNEDKEVIAYQGRAIGKSKMRYLTGILSGPKIYGLDRVDKNHIIYVTEGPIDSMFLSNCISCAGAGTISITETLHVLPHQLVYIYDNERRNREIIKFMERAIDSGSGVYFWDSKIRDKDINDVVMSGNSDIFYRSLNSNVKFGLEAKVELTQWKRC